jgi:hypothetical protein
MSWLTVKLLAYVSGALLVACLLLGTSLLITRASLKVAESNLELLQAQHAKAIADANLAAEQHAREKEQQEAQALAQAAEQYEKGKKDADAAHDRVLADMRAGTVQLRKHWAACETGRLSAGAASAAQLDAAQRDREESAARIVRAAKQCDEQVSALQQALRAR